MKPLKLRFRGLHSYRSWQEVDFSRFADSGLFGIFGPTGAGKSTVPDAITLALYGSVERAARGTQGIINLAEQNCEVIFTFELAGRVYTAQRLFKRVKGDPFSSKSDDCRLLDETTGQVLADKTTEMTAHIEELLNMDMQRFCQTVILPQGKFDRFLRLKPSERGNMLEDIFHLQEYGDALRDKAGNLAKDMEAQLLLNEKELNLLGECAPQRLAEAEATLTACRDKLAQAATAREQAQAAWQAAQALAEKERERQEQQQALQALQAQQPQMEALSASLVTAGKAQELKPLLEQAETCFNQQKQLAQAAQNAQAAAAAQAQRLQQAEAQAQEAVAKLQQQLQTAEQAALKAGQDSEALAQEEKEREQRWQQADEALKEAQMRHAASVVAGHLRPGEPCPVCGAKVHELPAEREHGDMEAAEATRQQAFTLWQHTGKKKEEAAARLAQAQQQQLRLNTALAEARESGVLREAREQAAQTAWQAQQSELAAAKAREDLEEVKAHALEATLAAGFASVNAARQALVTPEQLEQERTRLQQYRHELETARNQLQKLEQQLAGFDTQRLPALLQAAAEAENAWQALLVEEAGQAAALQSLRENSRRWQELQGQQVILGKRRDTAKRLQTLVKGKAFVRFLARERLYELAEEASRTMGMLSNQKYGLQLFEEGEGSNDFIIVDQYNGGQKRPVTTLSGGEIFLVSLSFALALSRNIEMQGETLGFFFLDEGFGSLDEDTLETVMGILERLPSNKRLVGLISHVAEVRARLPRYLEALPADGPQGSSLRFVCN